VAHKCVVLEITFDGEEFEDELYFTYHDGNMRVLVNEFTPEERVSITETLFQSDVPQIAFCNDAMSSMELEPTPV
jgi:hypothetical protein